MADEHGVAGGAYDHTEHGEPHISHPLWSLGTVADTQHVAHGFEQSIRVLHAPCVVHHQVLGNPAVRREVLQHGDQKLETAIPVAQQQHHAN